MAVSRGLAKVITLVPTLDTSIYASGDTLFLATEILGAVAGGGCCSILESITAIDFASQSQAIDLYFFSRTPASSFGAANAVFAPVDADMTYCLGKVAIAAADFSAAGANSSTATKLALGLLLMPETPKSGSGAGSNNTSIFVIGVLRSGTPTYGASDLTLKIGLLQE